MRMHVAMLAEVKLANSRVSKESRVSVITPAEPQISPPRVGMFRELLTIHAMLRRDLSLVRRLADEVRFGLSPEDIITQVRELETNSPLWRLKFSCMHYCRFVHHHHTIEDAAVFPMVRKHDPTLNSVVDRLEEDHLVVHHITERIVAAADLTAADPTDEHRVQVVQGLLDLEEHLLAHLAFEEQSLGPLLSTWDSWPQE
jgi:hypothetical protein